MARLQIFVAADCLGCARAGDVAHEVRQRLPSLEVELIELDGEASVPPHVVATPTYLLDGVVVSLGNPRPDMLLQLIQRQLDRAG